MPRAIRGPPPHRIYADMSHPYLARAKTSLDDSWGTWARPLAHFTLRLHAALSAAEEETSGVRPFVPVSCVWASPMHQCQPLKS
jgi:hypothetical protein